MPAEPADDLAARALALPRVRRLRAAALVVGGALVVIALAWPSLLGLAGAPEWMSLGLPIGVVGVAFAAVCWGYSHRVQRHAIAEWVAAGDAR